MEWLAGWLTMPMVVIGLWPRKVATATTTNHKSPKMGHHVAQAFDFGW